MRRDQPSHSHPWTQVRHRAAAWSPASATTAGTAAKRPAWRNRRAAGAPASARAGRATQPSAHWNGAAPGRVAGSHLARSAGGPWTGLAAVAAAPAGQGEPAARRSLRRRSAEPGGYAVPGDSAAGRNHFRNNPYFFSPVTHQPFGWLVARPTRRIFLSSGITVRDSLFSASHEALIVPRNFLNRDLDVPHRPLVPANLAEHDLQFKFH